MVTALPSYIKAGVFFGRACITLLLKEPPLPDPGPGLRLYAVAVINAMHIIFIALVLNIIVFYKYIMVIPEELTNIR